MYEHHQNIIFGRQYEPLIIPCKPTSPHVKVELFKDGEEVKTENFDIKIGFKLETNDIDENFIECRGYLNESFQSKRDFFFKIDSRFSKRLLYALY